MPKAVKLFVTLRSRSLYFLSRGCCVSFSLDAFAGFVHRAAGCYRHLTCFLWAKKLHRVQCLQIIIIINILFIKLNEWITLCSPTSNSLSYPVGSHQLWPSWQPCTSVGASACGGRRRWCCGWRSVWRKCCVALMPTILKWRTVRTSQYLLTSVFTHLSLSYVFSHVGQTRRRGANTWCRPAFETT